MFVFIKLLRFATFLLVFYLSSFCTNLDGFKPKINADRADIRLRVGVVRKAQQEAGLADARIADGDYFDEAFFLAAFHSRRG